MFSSMRLSSLLLRPLGGAPASVIALAIFCLDRMTKVWTYKYETVTPAQCGLDVVSICPIWNRGMGFGLLDGSDHANVLLLALSVITCVGLVYFAAKHSRSVLPICIIIGGAAGNAADRVLYGAVLDFVYVRFPLGGIVVFNVADVAIALGACLLAAYAFACAPMRRKDA